VVAAFRAQIAKARSPLGRREIRISAAAKRAAVLAGLGAACLAGTMVTVFPYGNQFVLDWAGMARAQRMTADIEHHVPHGRVGIGILYSGPNYYQTAGDEHRTAYLLLTGGWVPGMGSQVNQLLGMPIDRKSPFVVFIERGTKVIAAQYYPHYQELWFQQKL
jgi:hypothetical protein